MRFNVLTIFPGLIEYYAGESIIKRAIAADRAEVKAVNIRDFTTDKHLCVDDYPFGGGPGMVLKVQPIYDALMSLRAEAAHGEATQGHVVLLSPGGRVFTQSVAEELSASGKTLTLICGRYEGVDERVVEFVDEEMSIGDYVLTGGELAALVIIDAVCRLLPGVLGDERSKEEESFTSGLLDYPHYTRPAEFMGMKVPEVLIGGNHRLIQNWRQRESLRKTLLHKPDMVNYAELTEADREIIEQLKEEIHR
ncbi:MAG: tRNA (guanosine(37)-N1)-methyltransferase TrmD [Nitrospirae bacterium]|nr:tRNA (guanosine(37)-N1)-methyltransferase TrmD [Nitrospirota bacterium]MBF0536029.1 tRNA (guanosine(37)-N1)-methyltransferase TrmD [Nitrospirota bacterium]MBF0617917.1 tRNA (guanosine(37)-N1)-methyltransferase TrmD [Nitrospirota bacterium]